MSDQALVEAFCKRPRRERERYLTAVFQCSRGDVLLYCYTTPLGVILYRPRYRFSPRINEQGSSEDGRAQNTIDGDRRWRENAFILPESELWSMWLNCDHVLRHQITYAEVKHAVTNKVGQITVK